MKLWLVSIRNIRSEHNYTLVTIIQRCQLNSHNKSDQLPSDWQVGHSVQGVMIYVPTDIMKPNNLCVLIHPQMKYYIPKKNTK